MQGMVQNNWQGVIQRREKGETTENSTLPNNDNKPLIHVEIYLAKFQVITLQQKNNAIISTEKTLKML